jgi:hypothetical protein
MAVSREEELAARNANGGWLDANPFYLVIVLEDGRNIEQDLAQPGWIAKLNEAGWLRAPGSWYLVRKNGGVIALMMLVAAGEQPYYVARHAGFVTTDVNLEGIAYGIGKKRIDGHTDRLWVLANGCAVVGDDVDEIIVRLLKQGILPPWTP